MYINLERLGNLNKKKFKSCRYHCVSLYLNNLKVFVDIDKYDF